MRREDAIKVAVVATAVPRWTGALLAAEGVPLPDTWLPAWRVIAAVFSVGMAVSEGFGIALMLSSWKTQRSKKAAYLLVVAVLVIIDFMMITAPYIVASVQSIELQAVFTHDALLWLWACAVSAAPGLVVLGIGLAERTAFTQSTPSAKHTARTDAANSDNGRTYACEHCGEMLESAQAYAAHVRWQHRKERMS